MHKPNLEFIRSLCGLSLLFVFILLTGVFSACSKDKDGRDDLPSFELSPAPVSLVDRDTLNAFLINRSGSEMEWQVAYVPSFAEVKPMKGILGREQIPISIVTHPDYLLAGKYSTQLIIMSSKDGRLEVNFNYVVTAKPNFIFETGGIFLENHNPYSLIRFLNSGNAPFKWTIHSDKSWLKFTPSSGNAEPGVLIEVEMRATPWLVHEGINRAVVTIQPNSDKALPMLVDYMAEPFKQLKPSENLINLNYTNRTKHFYLVNGGTIAADWSLVNNSDQLTVSPAAGSLASGDSIQIIVQTIQGEILPDTYMGSIEIHYGEAEPIIVETKLVFINFDVKIQEGVLIGAVFNDLMEEFVVITRNPNELRIINPWDGRVRKTALINQPTSIAISPDRQRIVVGTIPDREVVVFDYATLTVLHSVTIPVATTEPAQIAYALNGHIYVAVKNYHFLFVINTETWTASFFNSGLWQTFNSHFILASPYANSLYVPRNLRLFKYKLENLYPGYLYDKPFQAFGYSDKIWALPDEKHLVNEKGEIFLLSDNEDLDLTPIGNIPAHIQDVAMAKDYGEIAVIDRNLSQYVSFYNIDSRKLNSGFYLPYMPYSNNNPPYLSPAGRYIFMSSDANKIIAICEYQRSSNHLPQWGYTVATLNTTER